MIIPGIIIINNQAVKKNFWSGTKLIAILDNGDAPEKIGISDKSGVLEADVSEKIGIFDNGISDKIGIFDRSVSNKMGISDKDIFDKTDVSDKIGTEVSECWRGSLNNREIKYKASTYTP